MAAANSSCQISYAAAVARKSWACQVYGSCKSWKIYYIYIFPFYYTPNLNKSQVAAAVKFATAKFDRAQILIFAWIFGILYIESERESRSRR